MLTSYHITIVGNGITHIFHGVAVVHRDTSELEVLTTLGQQDLTKEIPGSSISLFDMGKDEVELTRCEKFRDQAFSTNPSVRFMFKHLKRGGCELSPEKVSCKKCEGQLAGGYQDDGGILLCSNHLTTQAHTSNTLVHEAVHAFDACRAKVDWANCVHHACSEIRAAALSGDCDFAREVFVRKNFGFAKQFQRCVQRRAELSVSLNPYCDPLATKLAVKEAWDSCFNDTAPFEKLP